MACASAQTVVHVPQCSASPDRSVSQPLDRSASQLPQPELHAIEHAPLTHVGAPAELLQTLPHAPQWFTFVTRFVSHPLPVSPSQLPQPLTHAANVHVPVAQEATAFGSEQATAHPPQSVSVLVPVSQPLFGFASQSAKPARQVGPHAPAVQLVDPLALVHWMPHAPQSLTLARLVSQPLSALPSQLAHPVSHVIAHTPLRHEPVPWLVLHALLHAPQLATLESRSVSHPLVLTWSQLPYPRSQARLHEPAKHWGTEWGAAAHDFPQAPQWSVEASSDTSHPFAADLSQSA